MKTDRFHNLGNIIRDALVEAFPFMKILNVSVREGNDADDEGVLMVDVVFEPQHGAIDAKALSGAVRTIRPILFENDEDAFPVFSFISRQDAGWTRREAARSH